MSSATGWRWGGSCGRLNVGAAVGMAGIAMWLEVVIAGRIASAGPGPLTRAAGSVVTVAPMPWPMPWQQSSAVLMPAHW